MHTQYALQRNPEIHIFWTRALRRPDTPVHGLDASSGSRVRRGPRACDQRAPRARRGGPTCRTRRSWAGSTRPCARQSRGELEELVADLPPRGRWRRRITDAVSSLADLTARIETAWRRPRLPRLALPADAPYPLRRRPRGHLRPGALRPHRLPGARRAAPGERRAGSWSTSARSTAPAERVAARRAGQGAAWRRGLVRRLRVPHLPAGLSVAGPGVRPAAPGRTGRRNDERPAKGGRRASRWARTRADGQSSAFLSQLIIGRSFAPVFSIGCSASASR